MVSPVASDIALNAIVGEPVHPPAAIFVLQYTRSRTRFNSVKTYGPYTHSMSRIHHACVAPKIYSTLAVVGYFAIIKKAIFRDNLPYGNDQVESGIYAEKDYVKPATDGGLRNNLA